MKSRNLITLGLMISSIVLLVLLEGLWLYRSYEKEYFDFRRDVNLHLLASVAELRDSLLAQNIQPFESDSVRLMIRNTFSRDTTVRTIARLQHSMHTRVEDSADSNVRIFIASPSDSLRSDMVAPLIERITAIQKYGSSDKTFIVRINEDTLDTGLLVARYGAKLAQQGIDLPVSITSSSAEPGEVTFGKFGKKRRLIEMRRVTDQRPELFADELTTDPALYSPACRYTATLAGVTGFLLRQVTPEFLFVLLLTGLTCGAFMLVYGNLRKQQRLVESKNDFINNVTHELKTPVATVSVALEALRNFNAMEKRELAEEYLGIALNELERLSSITDSILRISVLENDPGGVSLKAVDLRAVVESVLSAMKLHVDSRKGMISFSTDGNEFIIRGAREHLSNTITNLIDNALKYSLDNPMISVKLIEKPRTVQLVVKDNGIGIAPVYHEKIFEKFFRVPEGDVHNIRGHGLGLNYVYSVVSFHNGTVKVNSEPGKGSEFVLTFNKEGDG